MPSSKVLAYHEPSVTRLLTLVSFVYLLNVASEVADYVLGAGLLGQCAVGVVYGPIAGIFPVEWGETFLALGYVALCLVVFEGGLTLDPAKFVTILPLAVVAALVGIVVPLALTFALFTSSAFAYPTVQAFTAGSALASTSLGTTFFVLEAAGGSRLGRARIANVLKGAALADDIVALVLLSVVSSLADGSDNANLGWTIARPIVASVAMCLVAPLVILYLVKPLFAHPQVRSWVDQSGPQGKLFLGVAVLCAYLAIAYYAGTTVLLGAFLAGVTLPFLSPPARSTPSTSSFANAVDPSFARASPSFPETYELYIGPIQNYVLVPLFFGSIGLSIPFLDLWRARVVWRGIVYAVLMTLGKVVVGLCIVVHDVVPSRRRSDSSRRSTAAVVVDDDDGHGDKDRDRETGRSYPTPATTTFAERARSSSSSGSSAATSTTVQTRPPPTRPKSGSRFATETLPAACFLGLALVARGEIGILVLQVAYNSSEAASNDDAVRVLETEPYLVAIWAVLLCTIIGPVAFARLVKSRWGRDGVLSGQWS